MGDAPPYQSHKSNGGWVYRGVLDAALTNQIVVLVSRCSSQPDGRQDGSDRDISDKCVVHPFL